MRCSQCGSENEDGRKTCVKCGAELKAFDTDETTAAFKPPPEARGYESEVEVKPVSDEEEAVLVVKKGPIIGQRLPLNKSEITIGRDPGSDIFLNDITVSRNHAKILRELSRIIVRDAGSLNGTYVNHVQREECQLKNGDELQVGKFVLVFLSKQQ